MLPGNNFGKVANLTVVGNDNFLQDFIREGHRYLADDLFLLNFCGAAGVLPSPVHDQLG